MTSHLTALVTASAVGIALLVGCAAGSEADPTLAVLPTDPADKESESIRIPTVPPAAPLEGEEPEEEDIESSSGGTSSGGTSSGGTGDGSSGGSSGGSSSGGSLADACEATTRCSTTGASSIDMGQVDGDTGASVQKRRGHGSTWLRVWVEESSWSSTDLSVKATLTSPPGTNYDLFLYKNPAGCSSPSAKSENDTGTDTASVSMPDATWGEDGYWAVIEVRHVSGPCDSTAEWELKVEGNK